MKRGTESWRRALDTDTRAAEVSPEAAAVRVPCLTVIHHPDPRQIGRRAVLPQTRQGQRTPLSRASPIFGDPGRAAAGPLADPFLSRQPLHLIGDGDGLRLDRSGSKTDLEVNGEGVEVERQLSAQELERGVVLMLGRRVVLVLHRALPVPPSFRERHGLLGISDALGRVLEEIEGLAELDAPVLVRGESGTGKELVAKALHVAGPRRDGPFVSVNMAAVPATLAAAELFGASRGAFSGADKSRQGYFRRADGGTLFLDEIGDTPTDVQPLLLRALETGEIQPVGADHTARVNVRVVAATDLDLDAAVAEGRFRTPLFHRLQALDLRLPPLRERRQDLGLLLDHFLRLELQTLDRVERLQLARPDATPWLPAPLVAWLALAAWPGNVRQLRNVARRLAASARELEQIPQSLADQVAGELAGELASELASDPVSEPTVGSQDSVQNLPTRRKPSEIPDDELIETLRRHRWRVQPAASALGISRPSLYERMDGHPLLRRAADLTAEQLRTAYAEEGGDLERLVDRLEVSADALRRRFRELDLLDSGP